MLRDEPTSWPVVGTRDIHRDNWVVAVREDQITTPDGGEPFGRLVVEHPGAVAVLAVDVDDRVLVVRQYRHSVQANVVEIPAGLLDAVGESPLATAKRELQEEAGYGAASWTHLLTTLVSPGMTTQVFHFFLARELTEIGHGDFVLEHEEAYMTREWVAFEELLDAVLAGDVRNGATATAVLTYAVRRQRGDLS
ncbi:NUDIX hydrolase [Nocardioides baekrokdamisoli]|uniref:NUDIX hydrolase n=1 Tax=Nocardioides baekrokdamisoli TaxID=1804624 RepID=A0A3G9IY10_9ACTN|nr:NUDIX hydrolase [Nocardioides baekrokdamisoli]BBH16054.1 NUDIX hydrolase [Nocardioides baekrokdamisoli]